jgi:hypothetical protein
MRISEQAEKLSSGFSPTAGGYAHESGLLPNRERPPVRVHLGRGIVARNGITGRDALSAVGRDAIGTSFR